MTRDRIVEAVHPNRILLFGSYARGDFGPDSDLDIFVEMESTERRYIRRALGRTILVNYCSFVFVYDQSLSGLMQDCNDLSAFATDTRYPDTDDEYTSENTRSAVLKARAICNEIEARL